MKAIHVPYVVPFASLEAALACLERGRHLRYSGEPVSHWSHALQTAALARRARAEAPLIVAALLHDIGHLATQSELPGTPSLHGIDDHHEQLAPILLARLFGPEVTEPIRLHVQAKRYLVAVSANYGEALSDDSRRSLRLQGGPMSASECTAFQEQPHADDALRLRCWDDLAKDPSLPLLEISAFREALDEALRSVARPALSSS